MNSPRLTDEEIKKECREFFTKVVVGMCEQMAKAIKKETKDEKEKA